MKPIVVHRQADAELDEAIAYYEGRQRGLGRDLLAEFEKGLARIQRDPQICPPYKDTRFRTCRLRRFPYLVFCLERQMDIWVAAVAHGRRKPDYWRGRTPE